jgi:2-keto-4-pentenoate hydratase/2-oxohepta-3-ene-1,7-dioic acid hydratase in catechol pathway
VIVHLATFSVKGSNSYGSVTDAGVVDLGKRLPELPTIASLFREDAIHAARSAAEVEPDYDIAEIEFLPPVAAGGKIICVGINYPKRTAEYNDARTESHYPNLFVRFPDSLVGHEQPLVRPQVSEQLDYEGEIVLVVGRQGRHIEAEDALSLVGGVTLGNEGTVRDWVRHGTLNVTQGKNFDRSGSAGPWIVPVEDLSLDEPFELETRVNGTVRQHDSSARLLWGFASLLSYISTFTTLQPGDLVFTGTPTGSGSHADPPIWLVPGDVLEIEVPGIGILRNTVIDEQ